MFRLPKPTRESFIPKGKPGMLKVRAKDSDAVAYVYDQANTRTGRMQYHVRAFSGKRAKPDMAYYYFTAKAREESLRQYFEGIAASNKTRAERKERQKAPHKMEVGTVLAASWGYEQTNVDFYQVTRILGPRMVEVREIRGMLIQESGHMAGRTIPDIDNFSGEPMRKMVTQGSIRISSCQTAHVWDGKPMYCSWYA